MELRTASAADVDRAEAVRALAALGSWWARYIIACEAVSCSSSNSHIRWQNTVTLFKLL